MMRTRSLPAFITVILALFLPSPLAAQTATKTCDQLTAAIAEETAAAQDGRWAKSAVGPVLRTVLIDVRARKRIEAACRAEQRTADATTARLNAQAAVVDNIALMIEYLGYRQTLSTIEEKRFDKQVGAAASSPGTTSPTSKGTVPSLIAVAVENGALLRTVTGTTVTFQAVPLNVIRALAAHDYVASAPNPQPGSASSVLSDLSVSVSVDTSRGATPNTFTGDPQQISGYGARYQILNWRDPRSVRYAHQWEQLRKEEQQLVTDRINAVNVLLHAPEVQAAYQEWRKTTAEKIDKASVDSVASVIAAAAADFKKVIEASAEASAALARAGAVLSDYFAKRKDVADVAKSLTLAFEYAGTKQAQTTATPAAPNLSTFTLVFAKGAGKGELTGNVGFSIFNTVPDTADGRVRDFRASAQLDVPLPEIKNIGKMVFSLSALVDHLFQEPLGQPVVINTVKITSAGTVALGQAKLTIPTKGTGVAIPLSVTIANRPEVVLETTTHTFARVNVGVSLDFDKLFAKP